MRTMKVMTHIRIGMDQKYSIKKIGKNVRYKWVLADQVNQLAFA